MIETSDTQPFGFFDEGRGEPVILLHSSLSSKRQWRRLQQQLNGGYRVLGLDLLGYGETPMPERAEDFTISREVELVERLLERVEGPAHLVGHSYGGSVALKTALRRPDRVRSVFAHEPVLFALLKNGRYQDEWNEIAAVSRETVRLVTEGHPDLAAEGFIDYWSGIGTFQQSSDERKRAFTQTVPKLTLDFAAITSDSDGLNEYERLTMPVLLTAGDTGPRPGRRVAELLAGVIPNGVLQIIEGSGHMAPVTDAETVNAIIAAHLRASSNGTRG